jgi:hypothetical protein
MSTNPPMTTAAHTATTPPNEEDLRGQLRSLWQQLKQREPLEPTYKRLLLNGIVTTRKPVLPKDKFYKRISSRLRQRVETFSHETVGKDPFDRLTQRQPLEEEKMRAAFTLRELKDHEQKPLLEAHYAALPKRQGMTEEDGRRHLEGVALGLQHHKWRSQAAAAAAESSDRAQQAAASAVKKTEQAAELERQRQEAQAREQDRRRREQAEVRRKADEEERDHRTDTPQQVLHKIYAPVFHMVWNLEFSNLGGINPFRMVIDRDNCAAVGAPDYFDIIDKPMNLTWIQQKVERKEYKTLQLFFADMDLMINNALKYNSGAGNPYRVAALELRKKYQKAAKKIVDALRQLE